MNFDLTISQLKDKGFRITRTRKELIVIFSSATKPLSAKEILVLLKKRGLKVNRTTIYRELRFLLNNRQILEVYIHHGETSYESSQLPHHHHLVCEGCGKIINVTNCLVKNLESEIYKSKKFRVKTHILEFYGMCDNCDYKH